MIERDILVAFVALSLGAMMIHSAILSEGWCFHMALSKTISKHGGHNSARIFIGSMGTSVILLGIYTLSTPLLAGFLSREAQSNESLKPNPAMTLVAE